MSAIVFSKNRAMQLDACLRSIERFAPYTGPITVLFQATNNKFSEGYEALEAGPRVRLMPQGDSFRRDVMDALATAGDHVVFHTDDDIFYRHPPSLPILDGSCVAFSLRLGLNTTYCHTRDRPQPLPPVDGSGDFIAWNWSKAADDFAYPMSLNGHIFLTRLIERLLATARFANPNELEDELHLRRYLAPSTLVAFRESSVVSVPLNVVTTTHSNRSGADLRFSVDALNERFLAGERVDLDASDFSAVISAHQEIDLAFNETGLAS